MRRELKTWRCFLFWSIHCESEEDVGRQIEGESVLVIVFCVSSCLIIGCDICLIELQSENMLCFGRIVGNNSSEFIGKGCISSVGFGRRANYVRPFSFVERLSRYKRLNLIFINFTIKCVPPFRRRDKALSEIRTKRSDEN